MGVNKKRHCRDVIFLILFVAYWVGMWIIAAVAVPAGDPTRLTVPRDSLDQFCGLNNSEISSTDSTMDLTDRPFLYYINPGNFARLTSLSRRTLAEPFSVCLGMPQRYGNR